MTPSDPDDSPRPGRIILPGAEPEPRTPGGSRIVLPPGVASETPEDLPEYPRLRPLLIVPVRDGERELLVVSDPLGLTPGSPVLGVEALPLLQLLDGSLSLQDLTAAVMRESKDLRVGAMVKEFIAQLDELLLLDSPRFQKAWRELRERYHALEIRQAMFEDRSYPADPATLRSFLDRQFAEAERLRTEAADPAPAADARPRAILAPHLDPQRAGATIARALLELGPSGSGPLRVVVFGTGHALFEDLFALTRKHFETPLGRVECDTAFVDALADRLGEVAYRSEIAHRDEHSIEFMALYLGYRLGGRPFRIVPILAGGFHALLEEQKTPPEDPAFETLITAVRETERTLGGDTLYLAGVDLSHVGPRFGDPEPDDRVREETEKLDRSALDAAVRGDAAGWFSTIAAHQDSTRICGFAPTYAMLRCAEPGAGRMLRYQRSDEPDHTFVSVAAAVWP